MEYLFIPLAFVVVQTVTLIFLYSAQSLQGDGRITSPFIFGLTLPLLITAYFAFGVTKEGGGGGMGDLMIIPIICFIPAYIVSLAGALLASKVAT